MAAVDELPDQYEVARKRAAQQNNAAVQGQQDAMKRRFAANGSINSGAAIKQEQLAAEAGQQRLQQANEGIDSAQRADLQRQRETADARKFSHDERLGTEGFQAGQADLGRKFQTGERLGSQTFQTGERMGTQSFQTGERVGSEDFAAKQAATGREFQTSERKAGEEFAGSQNQAQRDLQSKLANQDLEFKKAIQGDENDHFKIQSDLANKQFVLDKDTTEFNRQMAELDANKPSGILGSLLGNMAPGKNTVGGKFLGGAEGGSKGSLVFGPVGNVAGAIGGFNGDGGGGGIFG